ncbi:oxidoreductase [candidate division LCP-89 bacterium B3_LCP]|uniref:Oxidoreductase n=1 Tax=candidate division LCP-89 bacterium B3_LCP TaxID=2012998 RepID=A0A532V5L8_UNCL8|nr:MAG: oxidoreductase [candidate division LCP-89 bacterium B3_LCP]
MNEKCRIGVIGVGHLGRIHAKLLKEIAEADLVGVYDSDQGKAVQVANEFQTKAFSTYTGLLNEVDAVVIAASTIAHHELALEALHAKVNLLVEKPLADTPVHARDIIDGFSKTGLKLTVGHIERFNQAVRALDGINIAPRFIEAHRLAAFTLRGADVAVIHDLMIHDLDLILHWVDAPIKRLDASGVAVISDTPDIANVRIAFENGCVANITASRISRHKMRRMRMFQENAYLSLDFAEGKAEMYRLAAPDEEGLPALELGQIEKGSQPRKILYQQPQAPEGNALKLELEQFIQSVLLDTPVAVSGEDGLRAVQLAHEILTQIEEES